MGIFLLLLTGAGPLLAWRKTSIDSLKRNFLWPTVLAAATAIVLIVGGMKPWADPAYFYSLMAISLSMFVVGTVTGEFWRGGRVIARQTGVNIAQGMVVITRRVCLPSDAPFRNSSTSLQLLKAWSRISWPSSPGQFQCGKMCSTGFVVHHDW